MKKGWTFCISSIYQSVEMNAGEQRGIMSAWQRWIGRKNKEGGFITVMTAPSLRNLHSCNRPKVKSSHCERCPSFACAIKATTTTSMLFSTFRALVALKWRERWNDWWQPTIIPSLYWLFFWSQLRVYYKGQENTCTWLHATTHGKFIFHSKRWKTSVLPVQSQSGEQHILWQPLSVSVKGICLAAFIDGLCLGPMRLTERATGPVWKEKSRCQKITLIAFWGEKHNNWTRRCQSSEGIWLYTPPRFNGTENFKLESRDQMEEPSVTQSFSDIKMFRWKVPQEDILWCKATLFSWATTQ